MPCSAPSPPPPSLADATANGTAGAAFSYQIAATNSPTSYTASGSPDGLVLDPVKGVISGTPSAAGSYAVTLSAANSGGTATATLTIVVAAAPVVVPVPQITSANTDSGQVGQAFSYQITATASPTSYNATNLPGALTVDPTSELISGTPTAAGTFSINLTATGPGGTGTGTVVLTIAPAPMPVVSVVASTPKAIVGGAPGAFTLTRTGDTSAAMNVFYLLKGTGKNGVDYLTLPSHKKIKAGKSAVIIHVTADGDLGGEAKRTVKLVLVADSDYTASSVASGAKIKLLPGN